jgi:hypothetical protein
LATRIAFPTEFDAYFVGKSGDSGEFRDAESGDIVKFSEAVMFTFDGADGNAQSLDVRISRLDQLADFDVRALKKFEKVRITGNALIGEGSARSFFAPVSITKG